MTFDTSRHHWLHLILGYWAKLKIVRAMGVIAASTLRIIRPWHNSTSPVAGSAKKPGLQNTIAGFLTEVESQLQSHATAENSLQMSSQLVQEYRDRLQYSNVSMLPSYIYAMPNGTEKGDVIAVEVGGSTLRIAVVGLSGRRNDTENIQPQIRSFRACSIDDKIRALEGLKFFDWIASHLERTVAECNVNDAKAPLSIGLAWSFPIHQTSLRTAKLLKMGKGFCSANGVEGEELGSLVKRACVEKGLKVRIQAIVNDGEATLLSQAYLNQATRMSLILGTGTNAAVFLPISSLATRKLEQRTETWHCTTKVIVNTEMSMVGRHVFPISRWDERLNEALRTPHFQPLEYLTSGRYMGEIVRLVLVDAVERGVLFEGQMPERLDEPYALDTSVLAAFELDDSRSMVMASHKFLGNHHLSSKPRLNDLEFIRRVSIMVSHRAATYLATALHALWTSQTAKTYLPSDQVAIACTGAVIEKYPAFRMNCQRQLDDLCELSGMSAGTIVLELAAESSLIGAAVAACIFREI